MADVTLINLNMLYLRYRAFVEREVHTPLGCLYLISALEQNGISVDFRDYQLNEYADPFLSENFLDFIKGSADIIGFSCMANLLPFTLLMMKAVREKYPEKTLVLGGVGPKAVERKIMERFDYVDIIGKGEGEIYVPELIKALKEGCRLSGVPGIFYRESGMIKENPRPERISSLDELPLPAFGRIDLRRYKGYNVLTSRGCIYKCTFCSVAPVWDHTAYFRSSASIIDEMAVLHGKTGQEMFLFQDEFFLSGKERAKEFCLALKKRRLGLKWKAFGRINLVDEELMEMMADAGCIELRFGVESGSNRILREVRKEFSAADVIDVVPKAAKIFPRTDAFYVWGFPFESMADFHESVFQMVSFRSMGVRILPSLLCYLPQTQIYEEWKERAEFEFFPELIPEYVLTGHELCRYPNVEMDPKYSGIFGFIRENPDIFTGFFLTDIKGNVLPKLGVMKKFGFYPDNAAEEGTESCGAHSARVPGASAVITGTDTPNRCD
ncbi:MAG TPA: B12-binding domain-containing radical SAM protein, partial [bacterium]|nr:B12-binding domain-containing radical SAM protein [bacterium]